MLYGKSGFSAGNTGLWVGEDGVALIDDTLEGMSDNMQQHISTITQQPVSLLINTHYAKNGMRITSLDNLQTQIAVNKVTTKDDVPVISFSRNMSFRFNNSLARVVHIPGAYTNSHAVIYFPNENIVYAGDLLFNGLFPLIEPSLGGSFHGYIVGQRQLLALIDNNTKIIPAHGALASKADLKASVDMLLDAKNTIETLLAKGNNEAQILKLNPLKKYHEQWSWVLVTTEQMTRQVIAGVTHSYLAFESAHGH